MQNLFTIWQAYCSAPCAFPVTCEDWEASLTRDTDSDGRTLFDRLHICRTEHGLIQYGTTAFGFDENGEISQKVHHRVIRMLHFSAAHLQEGAQLLRSAMDDFGSGERVWAFFHYFGMSTCARHGKLHQSEDHVHRLLLDHDFVVEHENVYYSKSLTAEPPLTSDLVSLVFKPCSSGACREFAAVSDGQEIGWGQIHFLPQKDIAYLRWIYIDEKQQHKGYGTAIMKQLFSELYRMGIRRFDTDTALNNLPAQAYYEKTGFSNLGITRSYYTK